MDEKITNFIIELADGNPGALSVITKIISLGGPEGVVTLMFLMKNKITGSKIWILYKDICKENLEGFVKVCMFAMENNVCNLEKEIENTEIVYDYEPPIWVQNII